MPLFGRKDHNSQVSTREVDPALAALTGEYKIDPNHTTIGFTARHAMVANVRGSFDEVEGILQLNGTNPAESTATIDIPIASIDTGVTDRDAHLRSPDFFDAEKYPTMSFRSTRAEELGGDRYRMIGDLTIRDVTRPLTIDLEFLGASTDPYGQERVGFEGTAALQRSDWGLTWNAALETGGVLVSDKIKLTFDIGAIKQTG